MPKKKKQTISPIVLVNKSGKPKMVLPDNLTIAQLTVMGLRVRVVPKGTPMKRGELRAIL